MAYDLQPVVSDVEPYVEPVLLETSSCYDPFAECTVLTCSFSEGS